VTPSERIVRLEGLLERIARNASRPRAPRASVQPSPARPSAAAAPEPVAPSPVVEAAAQPASSVPPWKPEPASTVQARPSTIPPEELSEDDLIDVTTVPPPEPAAAAAPSAPAEEEEEPPASSSRSKVAESLDQAIASAAEQVDEREVPIHTPPPESGPQEAVLPAGIEAPRAPEFGDLGTDVVRPASLGPTPEQLGETIELEGSETPDIEIEVGDLPSPEPAAVRPPEELEVTLPRAEMPSGTYDTEAEAPPAAQLIPPPAVGAPEITLRPAIEGAEITHVVRVGEKAPEHFKDLLDASLAL
jgi:hypothetical protein